MIPRAVYKSSDGARYRANRDLGVELVVAERSKGCLQGTRARPQELERCVAVWGETARGMRRIALDRGALLRGLRIAACRSNHPPVTDGIAKRNVMRDRADRPTVLDGGRLPLGAVETFDKFEKRSRGICETSGVPTNLEG
jgi:hypothetical protein